MEKGEVTVHSFQCGSLGWGDKGKETRRDSLALRCEYLLVSPVQFSALREVSGTQNGVISTHQPHSLHSIPALSHIGRSDLISQSCPTGSMERAREQMQKQSATAM